MKNAGGRSGVMQGDRLVKTARVKSTCKGGIHLLFSFAVPPNYVTSIVYIPRSLLWPALNGH